jgi:hypothetical protein
VRERKPPSAWGILGGQFGKTTRTETPTGGVPLMKSIVSSRAQRVAFPIVLSIACFLLSCSDAIRDIDQFYATNKDNTERIMRFDGVDVIPRGGYVSIRMRRYGGATFHTRWENGNEISVFKSDSSYALMKAEFHLDGKEVDKMIKRLLVTLDSLNLAGVAGGPPYFLFYFRGDIVLVYVPNISQPADQLTRHLDEMRTKAVKVYDDKWFAYVPERSN